MPLAFLLFTAKLLLTLRAFTSEASTIPEVQVPSRGSALPSAPVLRSEGGKLEVTLKLQPVRLVGQGIDLITRAYDGMIPGPTIDVLPGDRLLIDLRNELEIPIGSDATNRYHHPNSTNLHVHGLHVSPLAPADDVFGISLRPGDSNEYEYLLLPDHSPGTYWAHPHHHGSVVMQAGAGAASALLVRDPPGFLSPQLDAMEERVLVLQNLPLALLQKAAATSGDELFRSVFTDDIWLVNGAPEPVLSVQSMVWYRLRLIMAGVASWLNLDFGGCEVVLLAKDGIYINDFPRSINRVSLPPGGRADIVLRCHESEDGTPADHTVTSMPSPVNGSAKAFVGSLFAIRSAKTQAPQIDSPVPLLPWRPSRRPTYLQDLQGDLTNPDCSCKTPLGVGGNTRWIDGHLFQGAKRYLHQWPRDAVAERSLSGLDKHSFHQHTWPYQLQETPAGSDPYFKAGDWHDTYQNVFASQARVRFSTVDYSGPEVVHCHALAHSDSGMIGAEIVVGRGQSACACDLLGEATPVVEVLLSDQPSSTLSVAAFTSCLLMLGLAAATFCQVARAARNGVSSEACYTVLPA
eukprot:TRINITY_DN17429_c0_g1_i2.p1 TRINITY_DN17429_c0_g1~~TRINITY_DN17429_c0_g1_i2.p1  ORF type:complete len:575 (+),score=74.44 TRINITY_DN17429_c0_g1_i2:32-1756(+)